MEPLLWVMGAAAIAYLLTRRPATQPIYVDNEQVTGGGGSQDAVVRQVQTILRDMGYYTGPIDGLAGPITRAAADAFARDRPALVSQIAALPADQRATGGQQIVTQAILARMPRG